MSSTAAKALALLNCFSEKKAEIGLSELARASGTDKATVHRMLNVLCASGLLEQEADSKLYHLGAGVLRLARIREAAFPVAAIVEPALRHLTEVAGETSHASLISGASLGTIGICPSPKSARVSLEAGETLTLHGTASGIAFLAFSNASTIDKALATPLASHTSHTETNPVRLRKRIEVARSKGFAEADQTYEDEVYGIAAPLFASNGLANGAIAVATPCYRMTDQLRDKIIDELTNSAVDVSRRLGGEPPSEYLQIRREIAA